MHPLLTWIASLITDFPTFPQSKPNESNRARPLSCQSKAGLFSKSTASFKFSLPSGLAHFNTRKLYLSGKTSFVVLCLSSQQTPTHPFDMHRLSQVVGTLVAFQYRQLRTCGHGIFPFPAVAALCAFATCIFTSESTCWQNECHCLQFSVTLSCSVNSPGQFRNRQHLSNVCLHAVSLHCYAGSRIKVAKAIPLSPTWSTAHSFVLIISAICNIGCVYKRTKLPVNPLINLFFWGLETLHVSPIQNIISFI